MLNALIVVWRERFSEILLFLIAGSWLVNGMDRMIALGWLPLLIDQVWDTSVLISDASGIGRLLTDFLGYRAQPGGILLLVVILYGSFVIRQLKSEDRRAA